MTNDSPSELSNAANGITFTKSSEPLIRTAAGAKNMFTLLKPSGARAISNATAAAKNGYSNVERNIPSAAAHSDARVPRTNSARAVFKTV